MIPVPVPCPGEGKVSFQHVVDALRNGSTVVPESFQSVSIMFADIIGFSTLVSNSDPQQVICNEFPPDRTQILSDWARAIASCC